MSFHAFYNKEHVGDVVLARLGSGNTERYTVCDDVVVLKDDKENIIGYNILQASTYFSDLPTGFIWLNKEFVDDFNKLLASQNLKPVEAELTPKFVVGKVIEIKEHPDSDHLHICQVDVGVEVLQIVCGAPNVDKDQMVVVALVGAVMPSGLLIKPSKLRGVASAGMICSAKELQLPNAPDKKGILVLDNQEYEIGQSFFSKEES